VFFFFTTDHDFFLYYVVAFLRVSFFITLWKKLVLKNKVIKLSKIHDLSCKFHELTWVNSRYHHFNIKEITILSWKFLSQTKFLLVIWVVFKLAKSNIWSISPTRFNLKHKLCKDSSWEVLTFKVNLLD
jgi:hypothetical protein